MGNAKSQDQHGDSSHNSRAIRKRPTSVKSEMREYRQRMHQAHLSQRLQSSHMLLFHGTHGDNIEIHNHGKVAERVTGFCDAIVFSSRPVAIMEKITVRLCSIDNGWSGALRLGFTSVDPALMADDIPRYACPDLTNKPGHWAKALSPSICKLNSKFTVHVDIGGKLQYSVNGGRETELLDGIDTTTTLWAIFDLYGNTKSLEILDPNPIQVMAPLPTVDSVTHVTLPSDIVTTAMEKLQLSERPQPACFSATMGTGLKCRNFTHVTRKDDSIDASYVVFTNTRLTAGQTAYFYCAELREHALYQFLDEMKFGIGITTCDPTSVIISEIPQDATMLMDRPEYWVFYRDFEQPNAGEYFSISVEREGLITYTRDSGQKTVLFYADVYEPLYLLLDLCGPVSSLAIVGMSKDPTASLNSLGSHSLINSTSHASQNHSEETPSTSRYPHESDTYPQSRYPGGLTEVSHTRLNVGPRPSSSSYPHDYVFCEPLIAVTNDNSSSDEDFQEASDQPGATARNEPVVSTLQIQTDDVPNIADLRTSLDELWRNVMHEPPPLPAPIPTDGEQSASSSKQHSEKPKLEKDVKPIKDEKKDKSSNEAECVICCDVIANSVMYPCGHACLCFDCGRVILQQTQSICPICRAVVKDVIRIYQS